MFVWFTQCFGGYSEEAIWLINEIA
jgi:hypothetical protein